MADPNPRITIRKPTAGGGLWGPVDMPLFFRNPVLDIVKGTQHVVTVTLVPESYRHPDVEIRALVATKGGVRVADHPPPDVTFNTPFVIPAGVDSGQLSITSSKTLPCGRYLAMLLAAPAGDASAAATIELFAITVGD
jgi:hypothetical protein